LHEFQRAVLIFSHTSYADFYILLLYLLSYPDKLKDLKVLIKPQPFEYCFGYCGKLLRSLGAIPSSDLNEKHTGGTSRIVNELKQSEKSLLLISPKGTIIKREWRSGYYHIAQSLNAKILVVGLDYEKKQAYISNTIDSADEESVVREK